MDIFGGGVSLDVLAFGGPRSIRIVSIISSIVARPFQQFVKMIKSEEKESQSLALHECPPDLNSSQKFGPVLFFAS